MIKILQVLGGLNYGGVSSAIMNFYRKLDKTEFHCDFTTTSTGGRWESEIKANGGDIFYCQADLNIRSNITKN